MSWVRRLVVAKRADEVHLLQIAVADVGDQHGHLPCRQGTDRLADPVAPLHVPGAVQGEFHLRGHAQVAVEDHHGFTGCVDVEIHRREAACGCGVATGTGGPQAMPKPQPDTGLFRAAVA